jgi:N-acetylglucosamine kinase-like BadF-type ATPase
MAEKYILGVDGGNSKTDYLLCKADGAFVDILRAGTCSHESGNRGYDWMQTEMQSHLDILLNRNNISITDIVAAGFGLAGADMPAQVAELEKRVRNIGFTKIGLQNDGILGVKAISKAGICSINGSGAVVIGIDDEGQFLQVGGIGELSGDEAGGGYIARRAIKEAYRSLFRNGGETKLVKGVFEVLELKEPQDLHLFINDRGWGMPKTRDLIQMTDRAAQEGDETAQKIFDYIGYGCGEGVVGCVNNLTFRQEVVVVMAGSIWNVIGYPGMVENFKHTIREGLTQTVRFELLESTPALGAMFWAKELIDGDIAPAYRAEMRAFLSPEKYAELAAR